MFDHFSIIQFVTVLFLLVFWHALADYPLQGDFIAKAKNPNDPLGKIYAGWVLPFHGLIHAGGVFLIAAFYHSTLALLLALLEWILHVVIDLMKCNNRISFGVDQTLHVLCKIVWALIIVGGVSTLHLTIQ